MFTRLSPLQIDLTITRRLLHNPGNPTDRNMFRTMLLSTMPLLTLWATTAYAHPGHGVDPEAATAWHWLDLWHSGPVILAVVIGTLIRRLMIGCRADGCEMQTAEASNLAPELTAETVAPGSATSDRSPV